MLSRLASGLVFCCLVSTCIFLPWLLCSCVLLCRMLGLPWAFFGPLPGLSWDPFWKLLAAPEALGPSWASPGLSWAVPWPVLGDPGRPLRSLLAALGSLLARPWAAPGLSGAVLAASWASFGASWAALGRRKRVFTKPYKTHSFCIVFAWFWGLWGPSWGLLGASWRPLGPSWRLLGGSWAVLSGLGWLLGRPKWLLGASWPALGRSLWLLGLILTARSQ